MDATGAFLIEVLIVSLLMAMVDTFQLIPSQALHRFAADHGDDEVLRSAAASGSSKEVLHHPSIIVPKTNRNKGKRKKKKGKKVHRRKSNRWDQQNNNPVGNTDHRQPATPVFPYGKNPNVYWSSIPMSHLRAHPHFDPMSTNYTTATTTESMASQFRQGSWQWNALHTGRCTTSKAVAALGFVQPKAASVLGVPLYWKRTSSYEHLRETAIRTLDDMRAVLISEGEEANDDMETPFEPPVAQDGASSIWSNSTTTTDFLADYTYIPTQDVLDHRLAVACSFAEQDNNDNHHGLLSHWGSIQEATTILIALNYFGRTDPHVRVQEVGMCGAGRTLPSSSLLIGATPDGILCHSNGQREVLEVKSHCPFTTVPTPARTNNRSFRVRPGGFATGYDGGEEERLLLFPYHVPQLQLEMYCTDCASAVLVRSTAQHGALLVRLQRDEAWIDEMLYWLQRFQSDFCDTDTPPPVNYFWEEERYQQFVQRTRDMCFAKSGMVQVVARLSAKEIQRDHSNYRFFLNKQNDVVAGQAA